MEGSWGAQLHFALLANSTLKDSQAGKLVVKNQLAGPIYQLRLRASATVIHLYKDCPFQGDMDLGNNWCFALLSNSALKDCHADKMVVKSWLDYPLYQLRLGASVVVIHICKNPSIYIWVLHNNCSNYQSEMRHESLNSNLLHTLGQLLGM